MPITQNDLWVINADQTDRDKLDKALDYIQSSMPINGGPAVEALARMGNVRIEINHNGDNRFMDNGTEKVIQWDPNFGLEIQDSEGNFLGVNSPAVVLLHEINHALDENYIANTSKVNQQWFNDAERVAAQSTNAAALEAGEVQRVKYAGDPLVPAPDPTERTMHWEYFDEFGFEGAGEHVWVEMSDSISDAFEVFGDVFEMTDLLYGMPSIGGSPWGPFLPEIGPDQDQPTIAAESTDANVIVVGIASNANLQPEFMFL